MIRRGVHFIGRWIWRAILLGLLACAAYLAWLPNVFALRDHNPETTAVIELRKDQARMKGQPFRPTMTWRPLSEISPDLVHAVLTSEDDTFYKHSGFDFEQIEIAVQKDWAKKRFVYGGSTLTQQLARTLYLSPHKNLLRKAKEALITIYLERVLTKRRILELYLNVAEWGNGIYGAQAAARAYYGIDAADLNADQAISLASILPSPRRWSPVSEKAFMARRRTQLAERMQQAGYLPAAVAVSPPTEPESTAGPEVPLDEIIVPDHPTPE